MSKLDRLGGALREVEGPLGEVLQTSFPLNIIPANLQLMYSQCGRASAVLQQFLSENGIETIRFKVDLPLVPQGPNSGNVLQHVMLETVDTQEAIDPTYLQFYSLIGLDTWAAQKFPDLADMYPDARIGHYAVVRAVEFALSYAAEMHSKRRAIYLALGDQASRIILSPTVKKSRIERIMRSVWTTPELQVNRVELPHIKDDPNEEFTDWALRLASGLR